MMLVQVQLDLSSLTSSHVPWVLSWLQNETEMMAALVSTGPLSVLIDASTLQFYHSGVWDPLVCDSTDLDHGEPPIPSLLNPTRYMVSRVMHTHGTE